MVVSLSPHQLGRERLLAKPQCYGLARTGARGKRRETVMKAKPASDLSQSPRFVFSFVNTSWQFRPPGCQTGTWILVPPVWIRLGSRKYWETEMITPVKPPRGHR